MDKNKTALDYLEELVNIPSYGTIDDKHPIIKYFMEQFSDCVETVVVHDENGNAHLLVGVNTPLENLDSCCVLSGHIDTVVEESGHNPKAEKQGENMIGLGTSDMKCFWASVLEQKERLKASDKPIILSITTDEETNLCGIEAVCGELKERNITPQFVIVGEPTNSTFSLSNMGNSIFINKFKGIGCHTSTPQLGVNAILMATNMISKIQELDKENDDVTICVTGIESKTAPSIVPDECSLKFGVRSKNIRALDSVKKQLEEKTDELSLGEDKPSILLNVFDIPPFENKNSPILTEIAIKNGIDFSEAKFTTEAGYFQRDFANADIVIYGAGDPSKIHKVGEFVNQQAVLDYGENLVNVIENYPILQKTQKCENKGGSDYDKTKTTNFHL